MARVIIRIQKEGDLSRLKEVDGKGIIIRCRKEGRPTRLKDGWIEG